jgi:hypothetical protein
MKEVFGKVDEAFWSISAFVQVGYKLQSTPLYAFALLCIDCGAGCPEET